MVKRLIVEGDDTARLFSFEPEGNLFQFEVNNILKPLIDKWVDAGYSPYEITAIISSSINGITARKIIYDVRRGHRVGSDPMTKDKATQRVNGIELQPIWDRLVDIEEFDHKRADKAIRMYRKYLTLMVMYPDVLMSPPSEDTDAAWHCHILNTQKYADDCNILFGKYRHHNPMSPDNPIQQEADKMIRKLWAENGMSHG